MIRKLSTKLIYERNQTRDTPPGLGNLKIWLHDIRSLHNVGSTFRSADAFGIQGLILSGYTPVPPRPEITKTALGADEFVNWEYFPDVSSTINSLQTNNYQLIGLEQTAESQLISDISELTSQNICLVFGNEVSGLDDEILRNLDHVVEIPQYGRKHSLNISVAVGISLYAFHENYRKNGSS